MVLPRIPSFEDLLKRIRQPKAASSLSDTTTPLLDEPTAAGQGIKIPSGFKMLPDRSKGISLVSPSGLNYQVTKINPDGRIAAMKAFNATGKPVTRIPSATVAPKPAELTTIQQQQVANRQLPAGVHQPGTQAGKLATIEPKEFLNPQVVNGFAQSLTNLPHQTGAAILQATQGQGGASCE